MCWSFDLARPLEAHAVRFRNQPDDAARHSGGDHVRGHILGNNAPRADDTVVANRHSLIDIDAPADPDAIADRYGFRTARPGCPLFGIDCVVRGVYADPWPEEHVVADFDLSTVQDDAVEIGIEPLPNADVETKLTEKYRFEISPRAERLIVFVGQDYRTCPRFNQFSR
jgi:hypothetical protein